MSPPRPSRSLPADRARQSPARSAPASADSRKEELLHAAWHLFRDNGFDQTSVDDICAAAGASKGAFYWHYDSKQAVFLDILEGWTRDIVDQMMGQFLQAVRSADAIAETTLALEREIRRGRVIVPLWIDFTIHARHDAKVREALAQFYRRARSAIADLLRPEVADRLDDAGLQGLAATVFGAYCGLMIQEMVDPDGVNAQAAVQRFMGMLGGLLREAGAGLVS
ncbi:MAG: TetR/AcrR family transcriptional regulator [Myxococcales bacterium]|nr:TetR/AcrR family transcriptional regulator [Myxococcales bacterium]